MKVEKDGVARNYNPEKGMKLTKQWHKISKFRDD